MSRYQKGKTNLDFTEARDSEWHWHQLGHMQVCTLLQTDNHASTPPLSFLQTGCPSCRPTNSIKALKALHRSSRVIIYAPNSESINATEIASSTYALPQLISVVYYPAVIFTENKCFQLNQPSAIASPFVVMITISSLSSIASS